MKITLQFDSMEEFDAFCDAQKAKLPGQSKSANGKTLLSDDLMPVRLRNCLMAEGISYVEDALALTRRDLLGIPNLGTKSVKEFELWKAAKLSIEKHTEA